MIPRNCDFVSSICNQELFWDSVLANGSHTEVEKVASDAKAIAKEIFMPTNLMSNRLFVLKWSLSKGCSNAEVRFLAFLVFYSEVFKKASPDREVVRVPKVLKFPDKLLKSFSNRTDIAEEAFKLFPENLIYKHLKFLRRF
ncbi:hypothetical protein AVEN_37563-1 [Araneus ventricosus]|uniref:Uncharacterized protein n=1 Tax=Araneus ventricosus TaxID=182803 RepID=A0A4Y2QC49_ARAVE|nr:hypothetical protein AVEN_37563-1 [Araneus ventricosus]